MTAAAPRALIFDWDNTLVDSWSVIGECLNDTLERFGRPRWSPAEVRQRVRASARDAFPLLFGDEAEAAQRHFYQRFEASHLERLQPLEGSEAGLRGLQELGLYLAVVSNKRGDLLRREAAALGWEGYFGALVGANDAARDKPDPAPVVAALAPAGLAATPESVWFVGDTDMDLLCAERAGCLPVLLRPEPPGEGEFQAPPPSRHYFELCSLWRDLAAAGASV